jgi:hypothetical protein
MPWWISKLKARGYLAKDMYKRKPKNWKPDIKATTQYSDDGHPLIVDKGGMFF